MCGSQWKVFGLTRSQGKVSAFILESWLGSFMLTRRHTLWHACESEHIGFFFFTIFLTASRGGKSTHILYSSRSKDTCVKKKSLPLRCFCLVALFSFYVFFWLATSYLSCHVIILFYLVFVLLDLLCCFCLVIFFTSFLLLHFVSSHLFLLALSLCITLLLSR